MAATRSTSFIRPGHLRRLVVAVALACLAQTSLGAATPARTDGSSAVADGLARQVDCYQLLGLDKHRPAPVREVAVAIDLTTVFTPKLIEAFAGKLMKSMKPGDMVTVYSFSAVSNAHHLKELGRITFDRMPTGQEAEALPVRRSADLGNCIELNRVRKTKALDQLVRGVLAQASNDLPFSEILGAVRDIGASLKVSDAPARMLVLASDGLQHSALVSFYQQKAIRVLEAEREVSALKKRGLMPSLKGVRVYVFGGGLAPPDAGFRDQVELVALEEFWAHYVKEAGGDLVAFGKPIPLVDFK